MLGVVTDEAAATGTIAASRLLGAALVVLLVAVTVSCGGGDGTAIATGTSSTRTTRTLTTPTITTPTRTTPPVSTEGEAAELPAATTAPPATTVVTVTETAPAVTPTTPASTVTVTETETVTAGGHADDSSGDRDGHADGDDRGCAGTLDGHDTSEVSPAAAAARPQQLQPRPRRTTSSGVRSGAGSPSESLPQRWSSAASSGGCGSAPPRRRLTAGSRPRRTCPRDSVPGVPAVRVATRRVPHGPLHRRAPHRADRARAPLTRRVQLALRAAPISLRALPRTA